jgi:arylsulfatase A-like enzyme
MKAIMVMFDTLNRRTLPPYGCDWVHAPNFARLAERATTFDNCYGGSMPCIPARRELHTGRYNFLHRSWGPLEPFDISMPALLQEQGVHTHLATDHLHYLRDGGVNYHTRYSTWEVFRGQEGDPWKGEVADPEIPENLKKWSFFPNWRQDWVNRKHLTEEAAMPQAKTFRNGLEFIHTNQDEDNWFLQIETFDPHEPFFTQEEWKELYPHEYDGPHFDWPDYGLVTETPEQVQHLRYQYAALVSMCDHYLGQVLDTMDELNLWEDTLLIVNTDHGYMLGEQGWWAKNFQPWYDEVIHIPLFIWDPRHPQPGARRQSLVQTIDLPATLLEYFDAPIPETVAGKPLRETVANDTQVHEAGLFGAHGGHVNVTDGRYVYMRAPEPANQPLNQYTLMPSHMWHPFSVEELQAMELAPPFNFTQGCQTMRIPATSLINPYIYGSLLFDLESDPQQQSPLADAAIERRMIGLLLNLMRQNDAPPEQYERLGLPSQGDISDDQLRCREQRDKAEATIGETPVTWRGKGKSMYYALHQAFPSGTERQFDLRLEQLLHEQGKFELDETAVLQLAQELLPAPRKGLAMLSAQLVQAKGR